MQITKPLTASFRFIRCNGEALFWSLAMLVLFFLPETEGPSLCVFKAIGINSCPGCGIGHSMHDVLRLQFRESFQHHPLGVFAIIIIFNRIRTLLFSVKTTT